MRKPLEVNMPIEPGLIGEKTLTVEYKHSAAAFDCPRLAPVFSTPFLVGLLEGAAKHALHPHLLPDESCVGISVNIRHLAPTPIGMKVRARAELLRLEGRKAYFKVEAWDEIEKIAEGEHERCIINWDHFMKGVEKKKVTAA